jgi:hypothetical protein
MASNLVSATISAGVSWSMEDTNTLSSTTNSGSIQSDGNQFSQSASGALQADKLYRGQFALSASATQDFDLAGSLTDFFGSTITMARVKFIFVYHLSSSVATGGVEFGKSTLSSAGEAVTWTTPAIYKGGVFLWASADTTGIALTAGSADKFRLRNLDGAAVATVNVVIGGYTV